MVLWFFSTIIYYRRNLLFNLCKVLKKWHSTLYSAKVISKQSISSTYRKIVRPSCLQWGSSFLSIPASQIFWKYCFKLVDIENNRLTSKKACTIGYFVILYRHTKQEEFNHDQRTNKQDYSNRNHSCSGYHWHIHWYQPTFLRLFLRGFERLSLMR